MSCQCSKSRGPGSRQRPGSKSRAPRPARATTVLLRCITKLGAWRMELGAFLLALCSFLPMWAQATSPHLISLLPTGAQRGTEVQVSFVGDRLQDAEEIICYEPGIEVLKLDLITNKTVTAQVKIAPDCHFGEHHLRLRTATGLSELLTFLVGPFPVVAEQEPNNDPRTAQPVPLNTTVTGVITGEDMDCFRVEVRKGQRLSAEVEGMRLGRAAWDARLTVLDTEGRILADAADTWLGLQDPFVSFIVPRDGSYVVTLRDVAYGGNDKCQYRLH